MFNRIDIRSTHRTGVRMPVRTGLVKHNETASSITPFVARVLKCTIPDQNINGLPIIEYEELDEGL
jgi:hypothetical protein